MIFTRTLLNWLDRVGKPFTDVLERVELSIAGERWWIVGPKGSGKTVLHQALSGETVSNLSYQVTGIHEKTTAGVTRVGNRYVRHKASRDFGGEYLETWGEGITEFDRFAFVYSLNDLDGTPCYGFNESATKPYDKYLLDRDSSLYSAIMYAFNLAATVLREEFESSRRLPISKRKLLVLCNKIDLWPPGVRPQFFRAYHEMVEDLKREAASLSLSAARFTAMYEACSVLAQPKFHFEAIMSKFLEKM
jgi:energy-coupling factor transporter ATP-binding protein EcfA2